LPESTKEREDLTGLLIGGRYRVGALIGVGGMGSVYEATREDLGNMSVAIKVLHPRSATDADLARFRREAHTVAAIDHPNIVRIIDFETPPDEPAFLVMERLSGTSLGDTIKNEGPLSPERTVFIAGQLLGALGAAHAVNVVHRDLKPDNVYLTTVAGVADIVKLLDFGIAKSLAPDVDVRLTQTGAVLGTPAYMAPEQARGAAVDQRSDLYAVGSLMYEALTGRPPFRAENYNALLFEIQNADPMDLATLRPDLDLDLVSLVAKATAREPAARFQTAQAMLDALGRWGAPPSRSQIAPHSSAAFAPTEVHPSEAEKPSSGPVLTGPNSVRRASVPAQRRRQASKRK
jgi:serine/threonine-protein kinase